MKIFMTICAVALSIFSSVTHGKVKLIDAKTYQQLKTRKPVSKPAKMADNWTQWVLSLQKNDVVSATIRVSPGAGDTYNNISTFVSFSNPTYRIDYVSDTCGTGPVAYPAFCDIQYLVTLKASARFSDIHAWIVSYKVNGDPNTSYFDHLEIYINQTPPPVYAPEDPPPVKDSKKVCGSVINVDGGVLQESVPITGTPFSLVYSSDYSSQYESMYTLQGRRDSFNPEGWSISPVHYFDVAYKTLFLGTGEHRPVEPRPVGSEYWVVGENGSEVYVFNSDGVHLKTKFGLTLEDKFVFSYQNNKINTITDAFGNVTTINRATYGGNLSSIVAPFGQVTTISVANSNIQSISNPASETYLMTYNQYGLLHSFKKPSGVETTFSFDSTGRLHREDHSGGFFWEFQKTIHSNYRSLSQTSPSGKESYFEYWADGNDNYRWEVSSSGLKSEHGQFSDGSFYNWTQAEETYQAMMDDVRFGTALKAPGYQSIAKSGVFSQTYFSYSVAGMHPSTPFAFTSLTEIADTNGRITTNTYTASDRTRVATSSEGATSTSVINQKELPISFKVGNDTPWTFTYNANGKLLQTNQGTKHTTIRSYSSSGYLESVTDALGRMTSFVYDSAGRVTQSTLPNGKVIIYAYNADGKLIGVTPPSRPEHLFQFDANELLSSYQPPALSGVTTKDTLYTYNVDKQLSNLLRPDGQSVAMTYGATTDVLKELQLARGSHDYQYVTDSDLVSNVTSMDGIKSSFEYYGRTLKSEEQTNSANGYLFAKYAYSFDGDHRLISRTLMGHSSSSSSTINIVYNNDSNPVQIGDLNLTYSYPSGRLSSTVLGLVSDSRVYDANGSLSSYSATYNPAGGSPQAMYSYSFIRDNAGRIIEKTETVLGVTDVYTYTYDFLGRIQSVTKNILPYSNYVYDDNGNRISGTHATSAFTATYDDQDRMLTFNSRVYSYNANGDNVHIQWNTTEQSSFSYDGLGQLIGAVTKAGNNLAFKYDGMNRLVQNDVDGVTTLRRIYEDDLRIAAQYSDSGTDLKEFIYATNANSPDYMIYGGINYRIIKDHLGSPRLIVKSDDGTVVQRIDYTDLGKITNNTNPAFQPFVFGGGIGESYTKLVKFGARHYDPESGRWTTKDPILFAGGDTNLYGYVANDPINFIDPTGLTQEDLDQALGYLATQRPELFSGINPTFRNISLPLDIGGITLGPNTIFLDFNKLDAGTCEGSADRVGRYVELASHELRHAQDMRRFNIRNILSGAHHDKIYDSAIMDKYNYLSGR